MALRDEVEERYPSLIPLLKVPEIARLLTTAVSKNWSPGKFQSAFIASRWFKSRSASQRQWWVTVQTDPGEALKQRRMMNYSVQAMANQMGIKMTSRELLHIREGALSLGVQPDDMWVKLQLASLLNKGGRSASSGGYATAVTQMKAMAGGDYYAPLPNHVAKKWGVWLITGQKSMEDFQAALQTEAMHRLPHLAERLKAGETVNDIVGPMRQLVAEELELSGADAVDMRQPKWRQLMGVRDPKSHKMRMMTESEVLKLARQDDRWGNTAKGKESQYSMVRALMQQMGMRKF